MSGLGKGITAASLGRLLVNHGFRVTIQKFDPYLNVDPGTMNPCEHGEVFVTDDGAETDLDLGHYERFLGKSLGKINSFTMGKVYTSILNKERAGDFLGKTIQVVPHVTNEIKDVMKSASNGNDIVIVEIGGTVGDIEGMAILEAVRQFRKELGPQNSVSVHVTLLPYLKCSNELKTRPTRYSVLEMSQYGINADIVVCRTDTDIELDAHTKQKIAAFCNLDGAGDVIHNRDCKTIYQVPLNFADQGLDTNVLNKLGLKPKVKGNGLGEWKKMVDTMLQPRPKKVIGIVGKYTENYDAYLSVIEAVKHAGFKCDVGVEVKLLDAEHDEIKGLDAIIVPGGFGNRGIEGKINAVKYARENNIPFLGICLGLQMAVIEYARNVLGLKDAHSTEINPQTPHPVICMMNEQKNITAKGGTMRLGAYECTLKPNSLAARLYRSPCGRVMERHRHRFEVNNEYRERLEKAGLTVSGVNDKLDLVEIIELPTHPYFIASQFHPEFLSRPYAPHPLFVGLINALKEKK